MEKIIIKIENVLISVNSFKFLYYIMAFGTAIYSLITIREFYNTLGGSLDLMSGTDFLNLFLFATFILITASIGVMIWVYKSKDLPSQLLIEKFRFLSFFIQYTKDFGLFIAGLCISAAFCSLVLGLFYLMLNYETVEFIVGFSSWWLIIFIYLLIPICLVSVGYFLFSLCRVNAEFTQAISFIALNSNSNESFNFDQQKEFKGYQRDQNSESYRTEKVTNLYSSDTTTPIDKESDKIDLALIVLIVIIIIAVPAVVYLLSK